MRFRNSMRLLMENFKNVYKILLYKLVIGIVTAALIAALLLPGLIDILESTEMSALVGDIKGFLSALIGGDSAFLEGFQEHFGDTVSALMALIRSKMSQIVWSLVGVAVVYLLGRFLDTLGYFAVGSILNDRMATYAEMPFAAAYVKNLGKASIYSVVYVPIVFLCDVATIALCWFLFFYLFSFLNLLLALFFSVTLVVVCQSLKLTLTSMWMPAMASDDMSVGRAMRFGGASLKKQGSKMFAIYIVAVYLVIIVNVVAAVCTIGSALLITVPASYFLFICIQFVNYYTVQGKKYFVTYDRIATNRDRGDSQHFFDTMEDPDEEGTEAQEEGIAGLERTAELAGELDGRLKEAESRLDAVLNALDAAGAGEGTDGEEEAAREPAEIPEEGAESESFEESAEMPEEIPPEAEESAAEKSAPEGGKEE